MAIKRFRFDRSGGIQVESPLTYTFTRAASTIDPGGTSKGLNAPRYDVDPSLLPAITPLTTHSTSSSAYVLATGVDRDGTEMMVVFDRSPGRFYTFSGGGVNLNSYTQLGVVQSTEGNLWTLPATGLPSNRVIRPIACVIYRGAIVVAGTYWRGPGTYELAGWAFAISQNRGATWAYVWSDEPRA